MRITLTGMSLGAGLMYLFDPLQGRRRRALLRDRVTRIVNSSEDFLDKASRDLNNRITGMTSELESLLSREVPTDRTLVERVRSKMGRYVSHPGAIEVTADQGRVVLHGQVLSNELDELLSAVKSVRGVEQLEHQLQVHDGPANIASLQGGAPPTGESGMMRSNLPPATRLVLSTAGLGMLGYCLVKRSPLASLCGTVGLAMLIRGTTNVTARQWISGEAQEPVSLNKTYEFSAPVERVWEYLENFDNYTRLFPSVKKVEQQGDGQLRWTFAIPTGQIYHLDELITERVPHERLGFKSAPNAQVHYEGTVHLQSLEENRTRVDVHIIYRPPVGRLGEWLASTFGLDPRSQLENAVMRARTELEEGVTPQDGAPHETPAAEMRQNI